jgi:hypothetical protein
MKNSIILCFLLVSTVSAMAQFSIRPQIGYNSSNLTQDFNNVTFTNDNGFQFGLDLQIGSRFYVQPGILWESTNNELKDEVDGGNSSFKINRVRVPLMLGYKFFGPETEGIIDVRIFTGPNASFTVNKDIKQTALISENDFKNAIYGWNVGAGLDIAIVFVDLGYSFGLSEVFENVDSGPRNNLFYINGGIRIGF